MEDPVGPVVKSAGLQTVGASADASIRIEYGQIRGRASASLSYGGATTDFAFVTAHARTGDMITIIAPGVPTGSPGTFTARVLLGGSGFAHNPPSAGADPWGLPSVSSSYLVQLLSNGNPGWTSVDGAWVSSEDGPFVGSPLNQSHSLSVPFTFGEPWELGLAVWLQAKIDPVPGDGGSYSGDIDLSNTITWLGIESISDEMGAPVSGATLTSGSGFDWTKAHPSAAAPDQLGLKIESFDGVNLLLTIDSIPSGQTFHLRQSSDGENFDPVTPPLNISDATPQPVSLTVDRAVHPTLLFQVYGGASPTP